MNDMDSMKTRKGLFGIVTVLLVLGAVMWYSDVIEGDSRRYEIRPEIRLPEYRSDAARAIDAYERLMERYMTLSESNLGGIETDLKSVVRKLDSIDGQLRGLSGRMGRIEKALGIAPVKPAIPEREGLSELEGKGETAPLPGGAKMPTDTGKVEGSDSYLF
jgi:hypothetical protein